MKAVIFSMAIMLFLFQNPAEVSYKAPASVNDKHGNINIVVDPNVELISVVQTIGKYPQNWFFLMNLDSTSTYRNDVIAHFAKYSSHPAVQMFDRMSGSVGFCFSFPANAMLYVDDSLNLLTDVNFEAYALSRMGWRDTLTKFLGLLKEFAVESDFNEFYNNHSNYYKSVIANTASEIGDTDYISELSAFYGYRHKSYNIVLVSLYTHVGYGTSLLYANGERELFDVMGAQQVTDGVASFGTNEYLKYMMRHEFSHPYINPLTLKNWDYIKGYSDNYKFVKSDACGEWQECINEFVIRAITTTLANQESSELGARMRSRELSCGVSCLDTLMATIREYQANREKYPTFDLFYSKVLDVFKNKDVFELRVR